MGRAGEEAGGNQAGCDAQLLRLSTRQRETVTEIDNPANRINTALIETMYLYILTYGHN